jgi:hypothetical protein
MEKKHSHEFFPSSYSVGVKFSACTLHKIYLTGSVYPNNKWSLHNPCIRSARSGPSFKVRAHIADKRAWKKFKINKKIDDRNNHNHNYK